MTEQQGKNPDIHFEELSPDELTAAKAFAVGDWLTGYDEDAVRQGLGVSDEIRDSLIEKRVVERGTYGEFVSRHLQQNMAQLNEAVRRLSDPLDMGITREDRALIMLRGQTESTAIRYRLSSKNFHNELEESP